MKDLYYILGTDRDCTPGELQTAYRKLVRKLRPDEQEQDHFLENHLQEISEAYYILSDPAKRRKYDDAFKRNYQRRLYYFKIKHLNVAVTLALLLFTGLFGFYVIRVINGNKSKISLKTDVPVKPVIAASQPLITHHKKRHTAKIVPAIASPPVTIPDTIRNSPSITSTPIENKPITDHTDANQNVSNNTTLLRANMTGVIYLHEQAGYTSAVVAKIPDQSKVTVLEKGTGFYKVQFNGQTGYVPKWAIVTP